MSDLEAKYQAAKSKYDSHVDAFMKVAHSPDSLPPEYRSPDGTKRYLTEMLVAKREMIDALDQMVAIANETNTSSEYIQRLLDKLHAVQAEYNELLSSDDQVVTLERIRYREEEKFEGPFYFLGGAFVLACFSLVGIILTRPAQ